MRLLWTTDQPAPVVRQVLAQRGYGSISAALPPDGQWRIGRRFPVLVDSTDRVLVEPFRFLFDVGFIRGSTRSFRTLETYAECLCERFGRRQIWLRNLPSAPVHMCYCSAKRK
jgi:hypothetical protein